jgi:chain length determinant protein tyrosine kinase EpsG
LRERLVAEEDIARALAYQFEHLYLMPGQHKLSPELVAAYQPTGPTADTLRLVRSELMHNWFARGHKALALASINKAEGASVMAANLAVVISQLEGETLLVDANLRRPRQHAIFGVSGRTGLADILVGRADTDAICKVDSLRNLWLLPAGTTPPNPQEMLSRVSFAEMSAILTRRFERIIFDLPAFTEAPDVLGVANQVGAMLLVVRRHHTKTVDLDFVRSRLAGTRVALLGSLLVDF